MEDAGAYARFSLLGGGEGNGASVDLLSMEEPMRVVVEYGAVKELDNLGMKVSGRIIISFTRRGQKFYALTHRDLLVLANEVTLACICWMIGVLGPCLFAKPGQKTEPFGPVKKLVRGDKGIVVGSDSDTRMMRNLRTVFFPMAAQIDSVLAALIKTLVALGVELRYDRSLVARRPRKRSPSVEACGPSSRGASRHLVLTAILAASSRTRPRPASGSTSRSSRSSSRASSPSATPSMPLGISYVPVRSQTRVRRRCLRRQW